MKTYVATKNQGKLVEMQAILARSPLELHTYPAYVDVVEGETSYVDNALLKARALAKQLHAAGISAAVLADDSGIEVEAMGKRPGVLSARYAGEDATWADRLALMLGELRETPDEDRDGRFVCVMALVLPDGAELVGKGIVEGTIARELHGASGFGYDPIFFFPPRNCTFAELTASEKNAVSHRRRAADALLASLQSLQARV
jgi:non-canonical purine NTP pyrophosphatase (RdgB/HAM1 family)